MKEDSLDIVRSFISEQKKEKLIGISSTSDLVKIQAELFITGIRALVGVRIATGYFTAETYIKRSEKSTNGVPYWERVFSPFGFDNYNEALFTAIMQGIDNFNKPAK